ncbi:hypothetical protein BASA81_009873 [Batrachochytrium salamandrivorans]|nr:hypothetical protein BASA81_009873 [Batrachochytrium salamandrivorans]
MIVVITVVELYQNRGALSLRVGHKLVLGQIGNVLSLFREGLTRKTPKALPRPGKVSLRVDWNNGCFLQASRRLKIDIEGCLVWGAGVVHGKPSRAATRRTLAHNMDLFRSFNADKLRLKLKLAETRIELVKNKKTNEIKKQKIEIATLLKNNQEELARIRTEHLVCDDFRIEVLGIVGLLCALLKERTKLLENSKEIPFDMKESCVTLVFAADRVAEIPELADIKQQLLLKFKRELVAWLGTEESAKANVNERVFKKLGIQPPNAFIVTSYMKYIAQDAGVDWEPKEDFSLRTDLPSAAPRGNTVNPGEGSGIATPYLVNDGFLGSGNQDGGDFTVPKMFDDKKQSSNPTNVFEFNPSSSKPPPAAPGGGMGGVRPKPPPSSFLSPSASAPSSHGGNDGVPDFDELTARFNALKGKD